MATSNGTSSQAGRTGESENGAFLRTLGFAQYRNRAFNAALATLTKAGQLSKQPDAPHLAFLAMTQFQLGKKADAAATLGRLRDLMKKPRWATDRDADALWNEAEELLAAKQ